MHSVLTSLINNQAKVMFKGITVMLLLLSTVIVKGQDSTYSFTPTDSEFVMQISRLKGEVVISIAFSDSLVFDYVDIERRADFNPEFSQCKYISYEEVKTKGRHVIKKDMYAYPGSSDVLYRLKLASKEGAIRTFPPLRLPAASK